MCGARRPTSGPVIKRICLRSILKRWMRVALRLRVHSGGYEKIAELSIKELLFKPLQALMELYFIPQRKLTGTCFPLYLAAVSRFLWRKLLEFINKCLFSINFHKRFKDNTGSSINYFQLWNIEMYTLNITVFNKCNYSIFYIFSTLSSTISTECLHCLNTYLYIGTHITSTQTYIKII